MKFKTVVLCLKLLTCLIVQRSFANTKLGLTFDGRYLKQDKTTFTYKQVVDIYTLYDINLKSYIGC